MYLLNTSDKLILDRFKVSVDSIGRYNLAGNFGNYFSSLANASGLAVGPMLNKLYKAGDELGARFLIFSLQCIFLIGTFLFGLWSKEIFYVLIRNEELRSIYPLAIIIVMSYNYRPMYFGANAKLMYVEKTNVLWKVTFVAGLLNVVLNIIFIPLYGITAAAVVTFISYMYMGYSGYFFKIYKKHHPLNYYPMWWLVLTIIVGGLAYYLVEFHWSLKIGITLILLLGLLWIYRHYKSLIPEEYDR
jgi:O-antigen/teichoic acid export membrane protein